MKKFHLQTEEQCVVQYSYVVEGDTEFDAIKNFIIKSGYEPEDHQVIADIKTLKIEVVRELREDAA